MREILFRGKRIDNGEWIEGSLLIDHYDYAGQHEKRYTIQDCYYGLDEEGFADFQSGIDEDVDPSTVGQYTGLKDVNGKRIFEGDVLHSKAHLYPDCVVIFSDFAACFMFEEITELKYRQGFRELYDHQRMKIIGNIYDNPELLEEMQNDYPMQ